MQSIDRRTFLVGAASVAAAAKISAKTPARRPNFLVLFPDQWRYDWMEGTPNVPIKLPHIEALAKRGVRFKTTVVASPLCAPSRACLASGKEYDDCRTPQTRFNYPSDQVTYYKLLRDAGYHTIGCGKLDLHKASMDWGIDGKNFLKEWGFVDGINNEGKMDAVWAAQKNKDGPYLTFLKGRNLEQMHLDDFRKRNKQGYKATYPTPLPDDAYCDNWITQNALQLLHAAPKDKSWHLAVNFTGPHDPEDITNSMEATARTRNYPQPIAPAGKYDAATHNAIRQNYTAMCENIDAKIGLILAEVEKRGELDNTIVFFSSDHGEMLGDHNRWGKSVPYESSTRVPLVVAGPGVQRGGVSDALVSHINLGATILDYAGVKDLPNIPRRSFRKTLEGKIPSHRDALRSGLGSWRMVRDQRYKLVVGFDPTIGVGGNSGEGPNTSAVTVAELAANRKSRAPMLFDLQTDPHEQTNIAADHPELCDRLSQALPPIPPRDLVPLHQHRGREAGEPV